MIVVLMVLMTIEMIVRVPSPFSSYVDVRFDAFDVAATAAALRCHYRAP
jgi:hypothetical protein